MNFISNSPEETQKIGSDFAKDLQDSDVVAVYGDLGAGKTQFIKGICTHFGIKDIVTSPTFIIVNEYITEKRMKIFHFDFYRVKNLDEIINIGFTEYLKDPGIFLVEWPELVETILPPNTQKVYLAHGEDEFIRKIIVPSLSERGAG